MFQTIAQNGAPESIIDLFQPDNWYLTIAVIILWMVAFMYGWWAISGKEAVPRKLMALTFIIITLSALLLTFYLSPEFYQLAQTNIVQFAVVFLGSGAFSIIFLPTILLMALGAVTGFARRRRG